MSKLRVLILLPLVVCFSFATVQAQTTLQLGTPIERTLEPGQVHEFAVNAEENSFVQLVVEQRGIDVVIKVSSPAGKSVGEYDTPNGTDGPEHVSFVAAAAGAYRITISPLGGGSQQPGRYEIKLNEIREATDQELKLSKNLEVAKAKGIALLLEIEPAIQEIKSPYDRIATQLEAAELLWQDDEKHAAKFMADATAGLKEYMATTDPGSEEYLQQFQAFSQLREKAIEILAKQDPEAALSFLRSTSPRYSPMAANPRDLSAQEAALELSIANQIIEKDPNRAVQIARRSLKSGYPLNVINTLSQLALKNPDLAKELVHEIAGKLLNEDKLIKNIEAANLTISLLTSFHSPSEPAPFVTGRTVSAFRPGLLSDDEFKQLLQKAVGEVLSYKPPRTYGASPDAIWNMIPGLESLGAELDKVVNGGKAAIEKKTIEIRNSGNVVVNPILEYQNAIGSGSVEAALEAIEKAPAEYQEQLYVQLAQREANNGDLARAKQIVNDYVSNPYQRRQALTSFEQQEMYRALGKGKAEEALRNISNLKNPRDRAAQLTQILSQIGPGQKRATALSLLEQARGLLNPSPQAPDAEQMNALLELARAFSHYDSKRSFEIVDPLIDQFNDICAAARTLQGFGGDFYDDDSLNFQNGNGVSSVAEQMSNVLGGLALANFERARAASDKIRLPEVRLKAYMDIAGQTIENGH